VYNPNNPIIEFEIALVHTDDPVIELSVPLLPFINPSMNISVLFKKHVSVDVQ
jgi:hypothetical protein